MGTGVAEAGGPHRVRSSVEGSGSGNGGNEVCSEEGCVRVAVGRPVREAAVTVRAGGDGGLGQRQHSHER